MENYKITLMKLGNLLYGIAESNEYIEDVYKLKPGFISDCKFPLCFICSTINNAYQYGNIPVVIFPELPAGYLTPEETYAIIFHELGHSQVPGALSDLTEISIEKEILADSFVPEHLRLSLISLFNKMISSIESVPDEKLELFLSETKKQIEIRKNHLI